MAWGRDGTRGSARLSRFEASWRWWHRCSSPSLCPWPLVARAPGSRPPGRGSDQGPQGSRGKTDSVTASLVAPLCEGEDSWPRDPEGGSGVSPQLPPGQAEGGVVSQSSGRHFRRRGWSLFSVSRRNSSHASAWGGAGLAPTTRWASVSRVLSTALALRGHVLVESRDPVPVGSDRETEGRGGNQPASHSSEAGSWRPGPTSSPGGWGHGPHAACPPSRHPRGLRGRARPPS